MAADGEGKCSPDSTIPEYARSWGPTIQRPTVFPDLDKYDARIPRSAIFIFPENPDTGAPGPVYVVAKSCDHCKEVRQRCSRGQPCSRCASSGSPCLVTEDGWNVLPPPMVSKSRKGSVAGEGVTRKRLSAMGKGLPQEVSRSSTEKETRSVSSPVLPRHRPSSEQKTPTVSGVGRSSKVKQAAAMTQKNSGNLGRRHSLSLSKRSQKTSGKLPAPQQSKKGSMKIRGKRMSSGVDLSDTSPCHWTVAPLPGVVESSAAPQKPSPPDSPRIWASSKDDLLRVLPQLSHIVNGVSWLHSDTVTLLLEGQTYLQDTWVDRVIEISMLREHRSEQVPRRVPSQSARVIGNPDVEMTSVRDIQIDELEDILNSNGSPSTSMTFLHPSASHSSSKPPQRVSDPGWYATDKDSSIPLDTRIPVHPESSFDAGTGMQEMLVDSAIHLSPTLYLDHTSVPSTVDVVNIPVSYDYDAQSDIFRVASKYPDMYSLDTSHATLLQYPTSPLYRKSNLTGAFNPAVLTHASPARFNVSQPPISLSLNSHCLSQSLEKLEYPPSSPSKNLASTSHDSEYEPGQRTSLSSADTLLPCDTLPGNNIVNASILQYPEQLIVPNNVNVDSTVPYPPPPDINALLHSHDQHIPVSIIMTRDCCLLPFSPPEEFECMFLGYFIIKAVVSSFGASPSNPNVTRASWKFIFEWIPGGEDPEPDVSPSPWWEFPTRALTSQRSGAEETWPLYPYMLLPSYFFIARTSDGSPIPLTSSNALTRKGWHCPQCGKLNVQRLICIQKCDKCKADNGMSPINVVHVRNMFNMAPVALPWDRYPTASVSCSSREHPSTGYKSFSYLIHGESVTSANSVTVTHLFTRNEPRLQQIPGEVWTDLQRGVVPLAWQSVPSNLAAGPYYTYYAKLEITPHLGAAQEVAAAELDSSEVALTECISRSRSLIETIVRGHWELFTPKEITILAWIGVGNRKSPTPLPGKSHKIAFLCLGADVELTLTPRSGFRATVVGVQSDPAMELEPTSASAENALGNGVVHAEDDFKPEDLMDEEDGDASEAGSLVDDELQAVPSDIASALATHARIPANFTPMDEIDDVLFLTLVHGDVVLLEGDDFDWSMRRTGMSMVLIAM